MIQSMAVLDQGCFPTRLPHFPPLSSSSFLSFSLPSCPIIIVPTDCVSQTFCRPTEVCQWQITLIKDSPKYSSWASSQFEVSVCHVVANEKGREVRGVQGWGNLLPYGPLGHYTNTHPHTHAYKSTPGILSNLKMLFLHFLLTQCIFHITLANPVLVLQKLVFEVPYITWKRNIWFLKSTFGQKMPFYIQRHDIAWQVYISCWHVGNNQIGTVLFAISLRWCLQLETGGLSSSGVPCFSSYARTNKLLACF